MPRRLGWKSLLWMPITIFVVGYLVVAWLRVTYPFDLEFIEDGTLMQALRMSQGLPVYLPPNAVFVPYGYPILYPWLGSLLLQLLGTGFLPLRLLSLVATLATCGLLYGIGRREGANRLLAAACAVLFLAGDRVAGGWYTLARIDALFLTLTVAGMAIAVYAKRPTFRLVGAALLFALSFHTKQEGLGFALATGFYLALVFRWRVWPYVAVLAAAIALPTLILQANTGGWYLTYIVGIQASASELQAIRLALTLVLDFGGAMGVLLLGYVLALIGAWLRWGWRSLRERPWLLFTAAAIAASALGRTSVGGNVNHLMPAYALLCLAPVWVWQELSHRGLDRRPSAAMGPGIGYRFASGADFLQSPARCFGLHAALADGAHPGHGSCRPASDRPSRRH